MKKCFKITTLILAILCVLATVKLAVELLDSQKRKYITVDR